MLHKVDHERLDEIRSEMMDLLEEAKNLVRQGDKHVYERAKAYWIGHIDTSLGGGNYIDTYDYTMEKTISDLDPGDEDEDEEDEDEVDETSQAT